MTTIAPETQPIRTMNDPDRPITYPTAHPSTLSADAQHVYKHGRGYIDRDLFDPKALRGYVPREEREEYQPSQRILDAIAELQSVGLASYTPEYRSLHVTKVADQYTVAKGRGSALIEVYLSEQVGDRDGELLAVLVGGDIESKGSRSDVTEWDLRARHDTATDVEHDAASSALLTVVTPSTPIFSGYGQMSFYAVLTDARLYPLATDPLTVEADDTQPGACDGLDYYSKEQTHDPHPFAPYLPPEADWLTGPRFVRVETYPLRPYLVAVDQFA